MADVLVTHIEKAKRDPIGDLVTALGNPNTPQGGWRWTREQVIASIQAGSNSFFVRDPQSGRRFDIGVIRRAETGPYLSTVDGGKPTDHLLQLAEFAQVVSE